MKSLENTRNRIYRIGVDLDLDLNLRFWDWGGHLSELAKLSIFLNFFKILFRFYLLRYFIFRSTMILTYPSIFVSQIRTLKLIDNKVKPLFNKQPFDLNFVFNQLVYNTSSIFKYQTHKSQTRILIELSLSLSNKTKFHK